MDIEEIYDILSSIQMGMRDKRNLAQLLFNGLDGQGTTDYNKLVNKPSINNVPLKGNLTLEKLGLTNLIKAIDTLTSTDKVNALSANQGRVLNNKITELINTLTGIRTELENKADSATTLKGYGITDAYTKQEVINAISDAIARLSVPEVDLTNYLKKTELKTINNQSLIGEGNINIEQTKYFNATQTSDGLMSKEDKIKLDGFTGTLVFVLTQAEYEYKKANGELIETAVYYIKG